MADLDTLPVRERVARLVDEGSFTEEGMLAGARGAGAVTGTGTIDGRPVAVMADDAEVEGGSWGAVTVEKVVRIQEHARRQRIPVVYLVDSTGARMPEQAAMFAGRRHAGRVLFNQVALSGVVPQVCALLGPSRHGSAYVPALCDAVVAREDAEAAGMAHLRARDDEAPRAWCAATSRSCPRTGSGCRRWPSPPPRPRPCPCPGSCRQTNGIPSTCISCWPRCWTAVRGWSCTPGGRPRCSPASGASTAARSAWWPASRASRAAR